MNWEEVREDGWVNKMSDFDTENDQQPMLAVVLAMTTIVTPNRVVFVPEPNQTSTTAVSDQTSLQQ